MKKIVLFLTIVYCTYACNTNKNEAVNSKSFSITGSVKGMQNGEAYFQVFNKAQDKLDTLQIINGKFNFTANTANPELAIVAVAGTDKKVDSKNVVLFFVEPNSKINIDIDTATKEKFVVTGSKTNDEFLKFKKEYLNPIEEKEKQTFDKVNPMNINNPKTMDSLMKLAEAIQKEKKEAVVNYINANKSSFVGAGYAYFLSIQEEDSKFIQAAYAAMGDNIKNSFYGLEFKKRIELSNKTDVGATAADFSSVDVDGKPFKLSDFYAGKKLVLIDFWASWCGPCRKENPNVVKAYNEFHSKGFEIVGVSLDEEKHDWIGAIKKDKLTWTQVSDLKGWESAIAKLYNVTAIPTNFLIDGTGKIVATNLRGEDLGERLKDLLK